MLFNKEKIKEALDYYLIKDADYKEKCNICIDEIIRQKNIYIKAKEIYERNNKTVELGFGDKIPSLGEEIKRIITRPIN